MSYVIERKIGGKQMTEGSQTALTDHKKLCESAKVQLKDDRSSPLPFLES